MNDATCLLRVNRMSGPTSTKAPRTARTRHTRVLAPFATLPKRSLPCCYADACRLQQSRADVCSAVVRLACQRKYKIILIKRCGPSLPDQTVSSSAAADSDSSPALPASASLSPLPASSAALPLAVAFAPPPRALFRLPLPLASRAQSTLYYCALRTKIWALTSPAWPQRTPYWPIFEIV